MRFLARHILRWVIRWIDENPDSRFSQLMLTPQGPPTDVENMTRLDRLRSAIVFLAWGLFFFALLVLYGFLVLDRKWLSEDSPVVMGLFFALAMFAGIGLVGGLYLLVRVIL